MPCWHWGLGFGWRWMLLWMVVWALLIAGVVYLIAGLFGGRRSVPPGKSALDILHRRYARGEISREEYLQMRRDLETRP